MMPIMRCIRSPCSTNGGVKGRLRAEPLGYGFR